MPRTKGTGGLAVEVVGGAVRARPAVGFSARGAEEAGRTLTGVRGTRGELRGGETRGIHGGDRGGALRRGGAARLEHSRCVGWQRARYRGRTGGFCRWTPRWNPGVNGVPGPALRLADPGCGEALLAPHARDAARGGIITDVALGTGGHSDGGSRTPRRSALRAGLADGIRFLAVCVHLAQGAGSRARL
jgi:hypothetical protein